MSNLNNITKLLQQGSQESFDYLYSCYDDCLNKKADTFVNAKNRADLVKLDGWLHNELPALISARKPDPYIVHDELINIVKWKVLRTCVKANNKNVKNLIIMNSPRLVMTETKKAFKVLTKKDNIQMALSYLTNLKGITLTTATLIMSLLKPTYPYMSDECIESIPEIYSLNYNITNYMSLIGYFKKINERLGDRWSYKRLEHVIWIYQMLLTTKCYEVLLNVPEGVSGGKEGKKEVMAVNGGNGSGNGGGAESNDSNEGAEGEEPEEEEEEEEEPEVVVGGGDQEEEESEELEGLEGGAVTNEDQDLKAPPTGPAEKRSAECLEKMVQEIDGTSGGATAVDTSGGKKMKLLEHVE